MSSLTAAIAYAIAILLLFKLDSEPKIRTSPALWLPVAWFLINGSRPLTAWFTSASLVLSAQDIEEGSPLDRNVYLVILIVALIVLLRRRTAVDKILRANPIILLFVLYCAASIIWSDEPFISFKRWIKLLGDFTMVLVVLTDPDQLSALKRVLTRVAFILVPVSVLLIKYYPDLAVYYDPWSGRRMVSGVAEDKNMLGMTCLVFGLAGFCQFLALYLDRKSRGRTRRLIAQGIVLAMVFYLFHQADSMTSLSCFIMASIVFVATSLVKMARKPPLVHVLVLAIVGAAFSALFLHIDGGALQSMGRNPTLTGRTEIWEGLLHFTANPLLGAGFDGFWLGKRLQRIWAVGGQLLGINEAHNGYLETYLNLGWIGVSFLAVFIVMGYRDILRSLRQDPDTARIRLAFFVVAIVYNFTEAAFRTTCSVWIAFLLATTAVPALTVRKRPRVLDVAEPVEVQQGAPHAHLAN